MLRVLRGPLCAFEANASEAEMGQMAHSPRTKTRALTFDLQTF